MSFVAAETKLEYACVVKRIWNMAGVPSIATIQQGWCKLDLTNNCGARADDLLYLLAEHTWFATSVSQLLPTF